MYLGILFRLIRQVRVLFADSLASNTHNTPGRCSRCKTPMILWDAIRYGEAWSIHHIVFIVFGLSWGLQGGRSSSAEPGFGFDYVAGIDEAKAELMELVAFLKNSHSFSGPTLPTQFSFSSCPVFIHSCGPPVGRHGCSDAAGSSSCGTCGDRENSTRSSHGRRGPSAFHRSLCK